MGDYICKLGTEGGEIIEKRFSSDSRDSLLKELKQRGYYILKVRSAVVSVLPGKGGRKIKHDDFIIFNQEFRALLKAGLPAVQSLEILIERQKDSELGRMLQDVRDSLLTGMSISDAFAQHKHRLPPVYISSLLAGERSGDLPEALQRFIDLAKLTNSMRKHFKRSLYYPVFLIILSSGLLTLMFVYVLPEFSKFYEGLSAELPPLTMALINSSRAVRENWLPALSGAILAAALYLVWRRTEGGRRVLGWIQFALPLVGALIHKFQLSQSFHSLAAMLRGGMPLVASLKDISVSAAHPLLAEGFETARRRVSEGETLEAAVKDTALDEDLAAEMIRVGESTGSLPEMLSSIAEFYDEEVKNKLEALLSLIEPVMLVVMAALIGSLLFAMYYPLFDLMGRIGSGTTSAPGLPGNF